MSSEKDKTSANKRFRLLIRRVNLYPPFLGMGIRVRSYSEDFRRFEVELRERWYTRNLFGTHFGGSLYTMCDPFYVFILTMNLGEEYIVWDQAASIEFLKPARGAIVGVFEVDEERLNSIRRDVDENGKSSCEFSTGLHNEAGDVVARVNKRVYVRAKNRRQAIL